MVSHSRSAHRVPLREGLVEAFREAFHEALQEGFREGFAEGLRAGFAKGLREVWHESSCERHGASRRFFFFRKPYVTQPVASAIPLTVEMNPGPDGTGLA